MQKVLLGKSDYLKQLKNGILDLRPRCQKEDKTVGMEEMEIIPHNFLDQGWHLSATFTLFYLIKCLPYYFDWFA